MERGKLWICVWIRENERERERGEFKEDEKERVGGQPNLKIFHI